MLNVHCTYMYLQKQIFQCNKILLRLIDTLVYSVHCTPPVLKRSLKEGSWEETPTSLLPVSISVIYLCICIKNFVLLCCLYNNKVY